MLIAAEDEGGAVFTDAQLADEVKSLLFAGHESTTGVLTWTLLYLLQHPDWLAQAQGAVTGDLAGILAPSPLDAILDEVMRLHPPSPYMMRDVVAQTEIDGFTVRPGTLVILLTGYVQRDVGIFGADPDGFHPERWGDGAIGRAHPYAFVPFGVGPRNCLGAYLAVLQMKAILHALLTRYDLKFAATPSLASAYLPTDRPAHPVLVRYTRKD